MKENQHIGKVAQDAMQEISKSMEEQPRYLDCVLCDVVGLPHAEIPEGAVALRIKRKKNKRTGGRENKISFYAGLIPPTNGYIAIPPGAEKVSFPQYQPHEGNINWGEPEFE